MKNIRSKSKRRWVTFKQAIREFFFKLFAVRKIIKIISKTYYDLIYETGTEYSSIFMAPSDFRKYSDKQIEHALNILVKHKKLSSWNKLKKDNEDGYLLVLPTENRSEHRILKAIPPEIDLNKVNIEPIAKNEGPTPPVSVDKAESPKPVEETAQTVKPTPTNNNTQTARTDKINEQPTAGSELIDDGKPF